jgi:hypothetical protein
MNAPKLLIPERHVPIARVRNSRDLFALVPRQIHHLLLVVDPADEPDCALTIALEIAEQWGPHITLVHGGGLWGWGLGAGSSSKTALSDLLCLSWQVKGGYRDVSISQTLPTTLAEVLEEAAKRKADLIMLPEPLSGRLQHPELVMSSVSNPASACPIILVMEPESDWFESSR